MSTIQIPPGWVEKKISDLIDLNNGKSKTKSELSVEGKFPVYGGNGITGYSHEFLVKEETIVIGRVGANCGVIHLAPQKSWITDNAMYCQLKTNVNLPFLVYLLKSLNLNDLAKKSAQPYISQDKILSKEILYPPLKVQDKIVKKLDYILGQLKVKKDEIFEKRDSTEKKIKLVGRKLFKHFLNKTIPYVKNSHLEQKPFSSVTKSFDNLRVPLNRSQRSKIQGPYPYYGASGQVDSINDYKFDGRFLLIAEDGENLISQKKPIAYIVEGKFWVNNHAHVVQTTTEVDLDYLCYFLNGLNIMNYAKKQATRPKLKKSDLDYIPIIFPELEEQKQFVKKIKNMKEETGKIKSNLTSILEKYDNFINEINLLQSTVMKKGISGDLVN